MKNFWISWYQRTNDYRPLSFPPNQRVLGWWKTGDVSDNSFTLVSLVKAKSEDDAKMSILIDWPEAKDNWRFCEERENISLSDRFQLSDWMEERINNEKN